MNFWTETFTKNHHHFEGWQLWKVSWDGTSFFALRWSKLNYLFFLTPRTFNNKINEISPTGPISYNFYLNKKTWIPGSINGPVEPISCYCPFNYHACFAWVLRAPLSSSSFLALIKSQNGPRAHKKIILTIHCYNSIKKRRQNRKTCLKKERGMCVWDWRAEKGGE